jgi:alkyl hydroperoxide reductase subunit AhpC
VGQAEAFKTAGASVVMIYPGAAASVQQYAAEFVTGKTLPQNFHFVTDPDLKVVNLYGLRWDAPNETAYPSTFVIDRQGTVRFVKISHTHGDRSAAPDVLQVIAGLK